MRGTTIKLSGILPALACPVVNAKRSTTGAFAVSFFRRRNFSYFAPACYRLSEAMAGRLQNAPPLVPILKIYSLFFEKYFENQLKLKQIESSKVRFLLAQKPALPKEQESKIKHQGFLVKLANQG